MSSLVIVAAYLTGAIPFGLLVARFAKGVDIRASGSGNIGATNVGRVLGARWGVCVLLLDAFKGAVPTAFYPLLVSTTESQQVHLSVGCGLAAVLGHMFPCWLRFRGGKGVATALGVAAVCATLPTLIAFLAFAGTFAVFRIVSLSSILAAVTFLAAVLWSLWPTPFSSETWSLAAFGICVPVLILVRHRSNLVRLLHGEEPRYRSAEPVRDSRNESPSPPPEHVVGQPSEGATPLENIDGA